MSNCKICNVTITDEVLKNKYYDPAYPSIHIGPYCSDCIVKVRICTGCHRDFELGVNIKYFGKGRFYCASCEQDIEACDSCGEEATIYKIYKGKKYCESCFKKEFISCDRCEEIKPKSESVTDDLIKKQYRGLFKVSPTCCKSCFEKDKSRYKKYDVYKCENCESLHTTPSEDKRYCQSCYRGFKRCSSCGKRHPTVHSVGADTYTLSNAKYPLNSGYYCLCNSCRSKISKCNSCGNYTVVPSVVRGRIKSYKVCGDCESIGKNECPSCLTLQSCNKGETCNNCKKAYYNNKCSSCGLIRDDHGRCRNCDRSVVYNYTFKPLPAFWYTKSDMRNGENVFLGIENEVTFGRDVHAMESCLKKLYSTYDPTILVAKSDSSISGHGFEVVTQPMTIRSINALDLTGMFWPEMENSSSCGMHIHVGRNAFKNDVHIYKIVDFIHNNEEFMNTVAGRSYSSYNSKISSKPSKAVGDAKKGNASRNSRVNLTNSSTIEFRMFAGSTTEFTYRYRVEFIHAIVVWAGVVPISAVTIKSFFSYVEKNNKLYPNLYRFLTKKCQSFV